MKALVISNCATKAYIQGMQLLFPGWEIRGVRDKGAAQFVEEGREKFLKFSEHIDVYVGSPISFLTHQFPVLKNLPLENPKIHLIYIPNFVFRGLQPDIFYLKTAVKPILPPDPMYSRLVVVSYLLGLTIEQALIVFNESVYRRMGYFDAFDDEVASLYKTFDEYGIDLREAMSSWVRIGQFVYTLNHAKAFVYFDILLVALSNSLIPEGQIHDKRALRNEMTDYLANAPIWPVYPELGIPRGIPGSLVWHTRKDADYEQLNLETFVSRSYENLAAAKDLSPSLVRGFDAVKDALETSS